MNALLNAAYLDLRRAALVLGLCLAAAALAVLMQPQASESDGLAELERAVPRSFGAWREVPSPIVQMALTPQDQRVANGVVQTYDQTLMRSYSDGQHTVMLALAYGANLSQEDKIHRPELCYVAQGFALTHEAAQRFPLSSPATGIPVSGKRLLVSSKGRRELVSYWIRIGDIYSENALVSRLHILQQGLAGRLVDGALVRVSQVVSDFESETQIDAAYQRQELFAAELMNSISLDAASRMLLH